MHGLYYIPLILTGAMNKKKKIANGKMFPSFDETIKVLSTFLLVAFTFIIFRSDSISSAFGYYKGLFSRTIFVRPPADLRTAGLSFIFILIMMTGEWFGRNREFAISKILINQPRVFRWGLYIFIVFSILLFKASEKDFIYLKF
jgi:D-alanyl-lipoteichoic acid acyltransferase DltB (MBOAT superfamily)